MSKKLTGNGLWESSRMMLPEHKGQLLRFRQESKRKPKPLLDEQRIEYLSRQLSEAMAEERIVRLTLFDPFEIDVVIEGKINKVDAEFKRIKVVGIDHVTWVRCDEIIQVE